MPSNYYKLKLNIAKTNNTFKHATVVKLVKPNGDVIVIKKYIGQTTN